MFRFTMKQLSGSHSQYLAKITHSVQCEYAEVVQKLSVLWRLCCALCEHRLTQCTAQAPYRSYYAAITLTTSVRPPCIHTEPSV